MVSTACNDDVRNQRAEDWWTWGGPRFDKGATGNCINHTFVLTDVTPAKNDAACFTCDQGGPAYFGGNVFRGCGGRPANAPAEIPCAPVTTEPAAEAEANVRAHAGCLPRDAIDLAYIALTKWGPMGERKPVVIQPGPQRK